MICFSFRSIFSLFLLSITITINSKCRFPFDLNNNLIIIFIIYFFYFFCSLHSALAIAQKWDRFFWIFGSFISLINDLTEIQTVEWIEDASNICDWKYIFGKWSGSRARHNNKNLFEKLPILQYFVVVLFCHFGYDLPNIVVHLNSAETTEQQQRNHINTYTKSNVGISFVKMLLKFFTRGWNWNK